MKKTIVLLFTILLSVSCYSQEISRKEALLNEYFELVSMKDMWEGMIQESSRNLPEDQREVYDDIMRNYVDLASLEQSARSIMLKYLNEKELEVYVQFMKNPYGKSSMEKMKYYMADLIPAVHMEMERAIAKYQNDNRKG